MTLRNRFKALQEEENEEEVDWIQWFAEDKEGKTSGKDETVVESGAVESVCPWDWASEFPVKEVAWNQKRNFRNASGGWMEQHGEKKVCCELAGLRAPFDACPLPKIGVHGGSRAEDHRKAVEEDRRIKKFSFDYCFPEDEKGARITVLVGRERVTV